VASPRARRPRRLAGFEASSLGGGPGGEVLVECLVELNDRILARRLRKRFSKTATAFAALRLGVPDPVLRGWLEQLVLRDARIMSNELPQEIGPRFYSQIRKLLARHST
jgi:hypothetical protein